MGVILALVVHRGSVPKALGEVERVPVRHGHGHVLPGRTRVKSVMLTRDNNNFAEEVVTDCSRRKRVPDRLQALLEGVRSKRAGGEGVRRQRIGN